MTAFLLAVFSCNYFIGAAAINTGVPSMTAMLLTVAILCSIAAAVGVAWQAGRRSLVPQSALRTRIRADCQVAGGDSAGDWRV